jgi:asparagine synthase (glutamine-hydrolysing)
MCGINGIISAESNPTIKNSISAMNDLIVHRGPDDAGIYVDADNVVALGMRRLSIIDIESGHQPMFSSDNQIAIVFNGEIYNYKELRQDLAKIKGILFNTHSDTEVVLRGYQQFGSSFFSKLNGMFAIAIHDKTLNKVFLVRDRAGEKPLYFWSTKDFFVFGSELKSLKHFSKNQYVKFPNISDLGINLYFALTFIPAPYTIYDGIYKIEPGSLMEVDTQTLAFESKKYWRINIPDETERFNDYSVAKKKLRDLVYDSVEKRMISDVPYGAFLSGGVDSSIITAVMADIKSSERIKTFSIISDNKQFDESDRSNAVASHFNTEHYPILLDLKSIEGEIDKVVLNFDEPFADSSALPSYFVAKATNKHVKVALTGDGGDEVFGGYNRYLMPLYSKKYKRIVPKWAHYFLVKPSISMIKSRTDNRGRLFQFKKFINALGDSEFHNLVNIMSLGFLDNDREILFNNRSNFDLNRNYFEHIYQSAAIFSPVAKSRFMDINICLEGDMLVKVDRTSMLNSLECRPPFLDHRLIEFSFSLPDHFLIENGNTKKILKETFQQLLPNGLFSMPKSGFGIPVGNWLRESLRSELQELSQNDFIIEQGIFNPEFITQLVQNHLNNKEDNTFKVWTFYCFQKWWLNSHIDHEA